MENIDLIRIRHFAMDCALQIIPVHVTEDGERFLCPEYDVYDVAEEVKRYILTGEIPKDELDNLLNN
jgi:hypothetical protein